MYITVIVWSWEKDERTILLSPPVVHKEEGGRREDIRIKYIGGCISCTSRAFLGGRARVSICAICGETEGSCAMRSQRCWSQLLARVGMSGEGYLIQFDCE